MHAVRAQLAEGAEIAGRYRLLSLLSQGGMGMVFKAEHLWTGQTVVMKFLLPGYQGNPLMETRLLREGRALARIEDPHAVRILDIGRDAERGTHYLVQEYLRGEDLSAMTQRIGPLPVADALAVMVPVMRVLIKMHQAGMVHRDVKPENIFLARTEAGGLTPKLLDFGVVRLLDAPAGSRGGNLTAPGLLVGTPHYMPPESVEQSEAPDPLVDVWAVGVVLYTILSGDHPFDHDDLSVVLLRVLATPVPRLDAVAPHVSRGLAEVVGRAMERDRAARFQSMQHFLGALMEHWAPKPSPSRWDTSPPLAHLRSREEEPDRPVWNPPPEPIEPSQIPTQIVPRLPRPTGIEAEEETVVRVMPRRGLGRAPWAVPVALLVALALWRVAAMLPAGPVARQVATEPLLVSSEPTDPVLPRFQDRAQPMAPPARGRALGTASRTTPRTLAMPRAAGPPYRLQTL